MKKKYEKPQIYFEKFSLCTHIAGDCESIIDTTSRGECAVIGTGPVAVFSSTMTGICEYEPQDFPGGVEDQWNGFCYHVPTDLTELFNS